MMGENRDKKAAISPLKKAFTAKQRQNLKAVSLNRREPLEGEYLPYTVIAHDRVHLSRSLNGAVDNTRRRELKTLGKKDKTVLKHSGALLLRIPRSLDGFLQAAL